MTASLLCTHFPRQGSIWLAPIAFFDPVDFQHQELAVAGLRGFCIVAHAATWPSLLARARPELLKTSTAGHCCRNAGVMQERAPAR